MGWRPRDRERDDNLNAAKGCFFATVAMLAVLIVGLAVFVGHML